MILGGNTHRNYLWINCTGLLACLGDIPFLPILSCNSKFRCEYDKSIDGTVAEWDSYCIFNVVAE